VDSQDIDIGLRIMFAPELEVTLGYSYELDDDNDDSYSASLIFNITDQASIGAGFAKSDDWDSFVIGACLYF